MSLPIIDNENDLRKYISRTHGEKLYTCDHCEQAFKREDMLNKHMWNMHKERNTREISLAYRRVGRLVHNGQTITVFRRESTYVFSQVVFVIEFVFTMYTFNST